MKKILFAAAFVVGALCLPQGAHAWADYHISVTNDTDYGVWVTTYVAKDTRRSIIKADCVRPHKQLNIKSQDNYVGGWTLFEIKQDKVNRNGDNLMVVERNVKGSASITRTANNSIRVNSQ